MAAIDLSADVSRPSVYTQASVGTTWQAYTLPVWASKVTIYGDAALYAGFDSTNNQAGETPADGGAVGTHRVPVAATTLTQFFVRPEDYFRARIPTNLTVAGSVFVAAQSGTATVTLVVE